jgi:hypothetical protein
MTSNIDSACLNLINYGLKMPKLAWKTQKCLKNHRIKSKTLRTSLWKICMPISQINYPFPKILSIFTKFNPI